MKKVNSFDTGKVMQENGRKFKVGINNVLTFSYETSNIEFWKDANNNYHVGIAYLNNNYEEFRYKHFPLGTEPKKWKEEVQQIKEMYDKVTPSINFENYTR